MNNTKRPPIPLYPLMLTTLAQGSKVLAGFALLKLIASTIGVEGLGMLANFMTLVAITSMLAGGGITNGVIKSVSELKPYPKRIFTFVKASLIYSGCFAALVLFVCTFFSLQISNYIFGSESYYWLIILLGFAQIGFSLSNLVTGVVNGYLDTRTHAKLQITGSLLGLPFVYLLIINYQLTGAALGVIIFYLVYVLPSAYFVYKSSFFHWVRRSKLKLKDLSKLFPYTGMLLISTLAFPIVEIITRQMLIQESGYRDAGLWQAAIRLSGGYLGFFSVFFAYYLISEISSEAKKAIIKTKIFWVLCGTAVIYLVAGLFFYFFRQAIIPVLLSKEFYLLEELIKYQLIGDFFRVLSLVFGYVAVAKAATKTYIAAEFVQSIGFLSLSFLLSESMKPLQAVFMAYVITYAAYSVLAFLVFLYWSKENDTTYGGAH